ncbi:MAG: LamG domain-containing protein, partial [Planctomycetota bacterium]
MSSKSVFLVSFGLLLTMVSSVRADTNLVAHYEFSAEDDFSNSIPDGAAGQPQGDAKVVWDDERDSYVLSLDGDGDYVFYESEWHRLVADAITVAAWVKTESLGSYDGIVGLGYAWRLYGGQDGNVIFQIMNTAPEATVVGTTDVNDGLWHHVAGSFDGTQYNLYVDGKLEATVSTSGSISAGTAYYGCIGAHYKKNDERDPRRFFEGLIDDVRIYDRILSESEVHYIFTFRPGMASQPNPVDGQTEVDRDIVLTWLPAETAVLHDVYFGADFNDVNDSDPSDTTGIYRGRQDTVFYSPDETLQWQTTYYWRIDEVNEANPDSPWRGSVWSFTVGNYLVVDDFEDYNYFDNPIWLTWRDGLGYGTPDDPNSYAGNGTGSLIGEDETWPTFEPIFVHSGNQSMRYLYHNNKDGYTKYSEAEMTLSYPRDWTEEDVIELSLWFIGRPAYAGGFTEGSAGTYTMTGSGADIWGVFDEFHFAFKMLSGPGSIIAKVESIGNTNDWAKVGVMIRETLDSDSEHAMMAVTPGNGVWF